MRIVIDLQGAQSESRFRGIGRYSLGLALGMARNAGGHEIWLALNAALGKSIEDIRLAFAGLVPAERIRVFDIAGPAAEASPHNSPRARAGELLREHAIAQLQPDAVLVMSLFEGYVDDSVVSVGLLDDGAATAVVLHDLIPYLNPQQYLPQPEQRSYYERKIASLRRAGLLLANSEHSRQEAIDALGLDPASIVTISTAVDERFHPADLAPAHLAALRARFGITRSFIMCAPGGFDSRKNVDGLIAAISMLPAPQRAAYQLVIAGKINQGERQRVEDLARRHGLTADEIVLTGYVSDADLIDLYRSCALFVFPSLHEGFGLPVLEAMACGALVLGADGTSIPEVIGNPEALFDGRQPAAIAARIAQVLGDPLLQARLREHAAVQARKFSWDASAQRAIAALEAHAGKRASAALQAANRPRIAFVSPLPPERTGISDYAVRLLPTLLPYFEVELIVQQAEVALPPELAHLPYYPPAWLDEHPDRYRHIVYQFGNSPFHSHMIGLLERHPGVVVLHDFYLSSMLSYEQVTGAMPGVWTRSLLHSHGYAAVQASVAPGGIDRAKQDYPCNLEILQDASHVIVHSDYARQLAQDWYGPQAGRDWSPAQLPRATPAVNDRSAARRALGIAEDAFVVCNFGFVAPTKHCQELLDAWLASSLHQDARCQLLFVGENHGGDYGRALTDTIAAKDARVRVTGWTSDEDYLRYLQAADIGVQLRTGSRGETSGTALDCMIYGLPVILNANGAMAEFPHDAVWMLPDAFEQQALVEALETLRKDDARRQALGAAGFALMGTRNSPERVGRMYADALALDAVKQRTSRPALLRALLRTPGLDLDDAMLQRLARCVSHAPDPLQPRQLLLDVTTIARNDLKTGIERVVRKQLLELMQMRAIGYRIEPVYFDSADGQPQYRYARNYAARLLGIEQVLQGPDPVVDVQAGDIFYSADHSPHAAMEAARTGLYAAWRARGASINFLIHDLLPVLRPEFFPPHADITHAAWLDCMAAEGDRLICVSRAVRDDLAGWLEQRGSAGKLQRRPGQLLTALHHGADLEVLTANSGAPSPVVQQVAARPSFLMVGTIEPRKGHLQALDAFEQLWAAGEDVNLVIVGREGWKPLADADRRTLPRIMERLRGSPELGKRLLWLDGIDDDTLQQVYLASSCLLFPSEGEGFGLPLIEAAHHGLPLLVRDLPVFREVAGAHAQYFSGLDGAALAHAVREWLALHAEGRAPSSQGMTWMTWQEQARALLALLAAPHEGQAAEPAA
jgi:glycosyltransferase involved in cell wall biosynthesis